jgi:hypothetical protein
VIMDKKEEPQLTYEQIIELRAQENEFKKEAHRRQLKYFAGRCSADWRVVASIGLFAADESLVQAFTMLLSRIYHLTIGSFWQRDGSAPSPSEAWE